MNAPTRFLLLVDLLLAALVLLIFSPATRAYYASGLIAHGLIAAVVFALAVRRAYWPLIGLSAITLPAALLLLPPHFGAFDLALLLWTLGGLPLIAASLGQPRPVMVVPRAVLIAVIALGVAISAWSLRAFPNFSATDEAMIFNYVDTFERTGQIGASVVPYDAPTVTGNLYLYAAALWTRLFRDPFALRLFSFVGGLLLIGVVGGTARLLNDDALTGWIAAALLATNLLWLAVGHIGRQEMWLAVFAWSAVGLALLAQRRQSRGLALLAGLVVALSADVHPLGAYACIVLGVWWVAGMVGAGFKPAPTVFAAFVMGGLMGATYYAAAHILPDPTRFLAALQSEAVSYGAEGWSPLAALIARHASYAAANPLEFGLLIGGSAVALRLPEGRRIGWLVGGLLLLYGLTVADPDPYYPMVWLPGVVILAALTLRRWGRAPLWVAFAAALALTIAVIGQQVQADWNDHALAAIEQVAARVPPSGRGLGETFLYLALRDPQFVGATFIDFWMADAHISRWAVVEQIAPDWIVRVRDEAAFTPEFGYLSVDMPHMQLRLPETDLRRQYRLTDTLDTQVGLFEVWQRR